MNDTKFRPVWGCAAIAKVIARTERQTFHLLESGALPAKKVGSRWVADEAKLLSAILGVEAII